MNTQPKKVLTMLRRALLLVAVALTLAGISAAQEAQTAPVQPVPGSPDVVIVKPASASATVDQPQFTPQLKSVELDSRPKLSDGTKMKLIQLLDAEFVHIRKYLPLGEKNLTITPEGLVKPADAELFQTMQTHGVAAKLGDKVQITNVIFHEKTITFEINGGPKKKSKWYQHISIGMGGNAAPLDPNGGQPTGASMTLQFDKHVPEMTGEELKKLVSPVLDFSVKSAAEVYAEALPPKIRDAIKKHEVLVGMNKDMVVMAKERPQQKVREKDQSGKEYEEWIYGAPPQDVVFVRFIGDEVTRVETAKVDGKIAIKTQKEVDVKDGVATLASLKASNAPQDVQQQQGVQAQQPTRRPTLKRPGEEGDVSVRGAPAPSAGADNPQRDPEPQWGEKKPEDNKTQPQQPPR
ncbi:MAG: hypothetical protein ACRD4I_03435 [Candidatus Angelobacter sp.]